MATAAVKRLRQVARTTGPGAGLSGLADTLRPMAWTSWRLVAQGKSWFDESFDHDGPACYELAIAGPRGGEHTIVYVGETSSESRRIRQYASGNSHIEAEIAWHLREGWCLYYRGWLHPAKAKAKAMQDQLLLGYKYPWNTVGQ